MGRTAGGDLEFETRLYTFDGAVGLTDSPFETTYWIYNDSWTPDGTENGEYVYLPFEEPIELNTENSYFAGVINEFESETQLTVMANAIAIPTVQREITANRELVIMSGLFAIGYASYAIGIQPEPFIYPGCPTRPRAITDPDAEEDDGSCEYESCVGCMDVRACNYDESAIISDSGSCVYPTEFLDCDGNCSDPNACNYGGWEATYVDGFETQTVGMPLEPSDGWYQMFPDESTSHVVSSSQAYEGNQSIELTPLPDGARMELQSVVAGLGRG